MYNQNYRAYPAAFIDKESAEKGDKLILPPSALQTLGVIFQKEKNLMHPVHVDPKWLARLALDCTTAGKRATRALVCSIDARPVSNALPSDEQTRKQTYSLWSAGVRCPGRDVLHATMGAAKVPCCVCL